VNSINEFAMNKSTILPFFLFPALIISSCTSVNRFSPGQEELFRTASENAPLVNEGFNRCLRYLNGWLALADPVTGLIPRNINDSASKDIWNAKDCAADNYPFMVLTSALLDRKMFEGNMKEMLETEKRLTSRIGAMPDTYSFSKRDFAVTDSVLSEIIFGSAEYIKDGLIPLTEWLGPSPWSERMISILDDVWKYAPVNTPYGNICSLDPEVNGGMLQALARIYWTTGEEKYLFWAERLGDYYLLGDNHPTRDFKLLHLRNHGCEIINGLCELYATESFVNPAKKNIYREHIHLMLDRVLEVGRNEDGLFYNSIDPVKGVVIDGGITDSFGYILNSYYTVYLIDKAEKYREPVLTILNILNEKYKSFDWQDKSMDGYADAIEGALNLYVREPVPSAKEWIDSEIKVMWNNQQPSGIIEGWHGDGNVARTIIMYCLWKTGGTYPVPWNKDLQYGGVYHDNKLYLTITSGAKWTGKVIFDKKRHSEYMHLPLDWPRINQFPEYFTVENGKNYTVISDNNNLDQVISGDELRDGLPVKLKAGQCVNIIIY
jgi:hypothetical protein